MRVLIVGLAVALAASIALNVVVRTGPITRPWIEYFPDMARTVRYNAFEANPNFEDGLTLRVPPPATIARGMLPAASDPATRLDADGAPLNPFAPDDTAALERGKVTYETFCLPCHGATGEGDGLVVEHGFPAPPSLIRGRGPTMSDSQIFDIITLGFSTMPSYSAQMEPADRWKTVLYLRTLQNAPPAAPSGNTQ
jgi:mono/diheme cytochrome c family protein